MDEKDRSDSAEARLFSLYESSVANLQEDVRGIGFSTASAASVCPTKLSRDELHEYVTSPVPNHEIRRSWLERLLLLATPQEQQELRSIFGSVLTDSDDDINSGTSLIISNEPASLRPPHFFSAAQRNRAVDSR